jgi:hypothetical protein
LLVYAAAIFVDHDGPPEYGRGPVNLDGALLVGVVADLLQFGEKRLAIVEELVELEGELNFHLVYVVDGETQQVADGEGLARELVVVVLVLQFLVPEVALGGRSLIVALRPVDVQVADVAALADFDKHGIVESWQNIGHIALGQEEYL